MFEQGCTVSISTGAASESLNFPHEDNTHRLRRIFSCVREMIVESMCTIHGNCRVLKTSFSEGFGRRTVLPCATIYFM